MSWQERDSATRNRAPLGDRVFRALLRLLPRDLRSEYGAQMLQVFRDQRRERASGGRLVVLRLWLETLGDLFKTAPAEHLAMLRQDTAYAWRMMRREKGFTLAVTLVLALGIGGNTAIFSLVHAVLLKGLPFADPQRLYCVWGDNVRIGHEAASLPDFVDWRSQNDVFYGLVAMSSRNATIAAGGEADRVVAARVTDGFFRVLGVHPALGRDFRADEDRPDAARVAILGDGLWQRRFGADPAVVGRTITVEGFPVTIVGVLPRGFVFPGSKAELWAPLAMSPQAANRRSDFLHVFGRLKNGVTAERAQAAMRTIAARLERQYPDTNTGWSVAIVPAHEQLVGEVRPALLALWAAVAFLLLVACTNVANLLLARGAARAREMAIRAALGAGRSRLLRQALTESVLLAMLGGAVGLVLAYYGIDVLVRFGPADTPRLDEAGLHLPVVAVALVMSLGTGILFGLVPASAIARKQLQGTLKDGGPAGNSRSRTRMNGALVAVQTAVSLILLIGAALMLRSFGAISHVDPGFVSDQVLSFRVSLPAAGYGPDVARQRRFCDDLAGRVAVLPGVTRVAATNAMYLNGANYWSFQIEGAPRPERGQEPDAEVRSVTAPFHQALGIRLLRGRTFDRNDVAGRPRVALVNATFEKRFAAGTSIIGRRVSFGQEDGQPVWWQIVGVVTDVRQDGLDQAVYPEVQLPFSQSPSRSMTFLVKGSGDPAALVPAIRRVIRELDATAAMFEVQTVDEAIAATTATRRFSAYLLATFAAIALLLAACGLYGVVAYRVARSRQEIGVRVALGAGPSDVVRTILLRGMRAAFAGVAFGLPAAWLLSSYLGTLLFGVTPHDTTTFGGVSALLLAACALACYIPARRATRVDPLTALKSE